MPRLLDLQLARFMRRKASVVQAFRSRIGPSLRLHRAALGLGLSLSLSCAPGTGSVSSLVATAEAKNLVDAYAKIETLPDFQVLLQQYQRFGADLSDGPVVDTVTIRGRVYQGFSKMVEASAKGIDAKKVLSGRSYQERLAAYGLLTSKLKPADVDALLAIVKSFVEVGGDLEGHKEILARFSAEETLRSVNTAIILQAISKFSQRQQSALGLSGVSDSGIPSGGRVNGRVAIAEGVTAMAKLIVGGVTESVKNIDLAKSIDEHTKLLNLCTKSRTDLNTEVKRLLSCQQAMPAASSCDEGTAASANPIMTNGDAKCVDVKFKCTCQDTMEPGKKSCFWLKWSDDASDASAAQPPPAAATPGASRGACSNL